MRIAISSKSGCGNTTVSTLLAQRLGFPLINFTFRQMAQERGVDFWTFCSMAEGDDDIDSVLGSRLAIWMLKDADLKVYLTASPARRAERIFKREGGSLEERLEQTERRDANDSARYRRIYGIDNCDTSPADLVIDTDDRTPDQIVEMIVQEVDRRRAQ